MGGNKDWILQSSSRKPVKFDEKTGLDRLKNRLKTEKPATSAGFRVNCANGFVFGFVAYYLLNGASVGTPSNPANDLLAALAGSIQGVNGDKFDLQQVQRSSQL